MEAIAAIISDLCLADCIPRSSATTPTTRRPSSSRPYLPGLAERHGVAVTRIMYAATVAGEAPASAIVRDLLKSDESSHSRRPKEVTIAPLIDASKRSPEEQAALKASAPRRRQPRRKPTAPARPSAAARDRA